MGINVFSEASLAEFAFNESGMRELLEGPVLQDLVKRAIRVESLAKQHATGRPGPNVITGRLRDSITWKPGRDAKSPYVDIGSNVLYAPYVELGTSRAPSYPFLRPALEAVRADTT